MSWPRLSAAWSAVVRPSLVRRLLMAQMGVLGLVWALLLGVMVWGESNRNGLLDNELLYRSLLAVAQSLADQPGRRHDSLHAMDRAARDAQAQRADGLDVVPAVFVWQRDELLYRSAGDTPALRTRSAGSVEAFAAVERRWLARSLDSADGSLRATLVVPDARHGIPRVPEESYLIAPLLVCLPFLVLPAWWSVHVALRPWRRLSAEIAACGPSDLRPLAQVSAHRELQPLVQALNQLLARLSGSMARERNLIADAAHELRTPLAAMRVNVEVLRNHGLPPEMMDNLLRSNERASRLVAQLLRLMRSDAAEELQPDEAVALDRLLQERLAQYEGLARRQGVELVLEACCAVSVMGRLESLESLIDNLVDNAVKYSPRGGIVSVRLTASAGRARLEFRDQGPGIDAQWRERVFDRFFRMPDQVQNGSGLGLAIVRSAVLRHAGQVELANVAGGPGLCVRVDLPSLES